jgi:hypothetical protein
VLDSLTTEQFNAARRANPQTAAPAETQVFPNPTYHFINFDLGEAYQPGEAVTIYVFDLMGQLKRQKQTTHTAGALINIDMADLPASIYTVEVRQAGHREHFKVLKNTGQP